MLMPDRVRRDLVRAVSVVKALPSLSAYPPGPPIRVAGALVGFKLAGLGSHAANPVVQTMEALIP